MRKSGLLMIAKQSKHLWEPESSEMANIDLKFIGLDKRMFLKYFKNVVMFIMSDNVVVLYT